LQIHQNEMSVLPRSSKLQERKRLIRTYHVEQYPRTPDQAYILKN